MVNFILYKNKGVLRKLKIDNIYISALCFLNLDITYNDKN